MVQQPIDFDLSQCHELEQLIQRPDLLPPGIGARPRTQREYEWTQHGLDQPIRVTTNPVYFEANPESFELWSPDGVLVLEVDEVAEPEEVADVRGLGELLG